MRDNFTSKTRLALAEIVNFKCTRPDCGRLTRGPSGDLTFVVNVGHTAHVTAASKGGPRYDDSLTPEQRRAADNGSHLCANCATLVDRDPNTYPPHVLKEWQLKAVELTRRQFLQPARYGVANTASVNAEVRKFLVKCKRFRALHIYEGTVFSDRDLFPIFDLLSACKWHYRVPCGGGRGTTWQAGDELHAQDSHAVNIQIEILSSLAALVASIQTPGSGWYHEGSLYRIEGMVSWGLADPWDDDLKRKISSTVERTNQLIQRYQEGCDKLRQYVSEANTYTSI